MRGIIVMMFCILALAFGLLAYATRDWFGVGAMVFCMAAIILMDAWEDRKKRRLSESLRRRQ